MSLLVTSVASALAVRAGARVIRGRRGWLAVLARPGVFRLWPQDQRPYREYCRAVMLNR